MPLEKEIGYSSELQPYTDDEDHQELSADIFSKIMDVHLLMLASGGFITVRM